MTSFSVKPFESVVLTPYLPAGISEEMSAKRTKTILLLEHDQADIFFFRRALASLDFRGIVRVMESVADARDYLEGRWKYSDRHYYPLPDLIVSDLKVPGRTGLEFLEWLQGEEKFRHIPFVMYSGAATTEESIEVIARGARAFVRKEIDFDEAIQAVDEVLKHLPETD
jgi:CheY-like chemotaxis protein